MPRPVDARSLVGTAALTLGLWLWMISSAYYWHLASANDVVLPHIPRILWMLPGELWRLAPPGWLVLLALAPVGAHWLRGQAQAARLLRRTVLGLVAVSIIVALVWGRALVNASGGG